MHYEENVLKYLKTSKAWIVDSRVPQANFSSLYTVLYCQLMDAAHTYLTIKIQ